MSGRRPPTSRDGSWLILRSFTGGSGRDIYARRTAGDTAIRELVATPVNEVTPALSPDGRWLAYVSEESGRNEVFLRPFPNISEAKRQVSIKGGSEPVWAHSGRELFFVDGDNQLVAAEISAAPVLTVGRQQVLFSRARFAGDPLHPRYAVAPDDRRFLMVQFMAGGDELVLVQNWFEVLKRKLKR